MKPFFIKILIYIFVSAGAFFGFVEYYKSGFLDIYYPKFLKPSTSLILGSSRSHYGLNPSLLKVRKDVLNFAFSLSLSPWGPTYLNAIKHKIKSDGSRNGIFIVEVTPLLFEEPIANVNDDPDLFLERKTLLGNQKIFNANPNYDFIVNNLTPLSKIPMQDINGVRDCILHSNGWIELRKESKWNKVQTKKSKNRIVNPVKKYISNVRVKSFEEMIDYLQENGQVYLVRIPISPEMDSLEYKNWPQFENYIANFALKKGLHYFNLQKEFPNLKTFDGNHLLPSEANKISVFLNSKIEFIEKKN